MAYGYVYGYVAGPFTRSLCAGRPCGSNIVVVC